MPVGDKQKLIAEIVGTVLQEKPRNDKFEWFINSHNENHFQHNFNLIHEIFITLNGNRFANQSKRISYLQCDAYFANQNMIFEFDEFQHFSSSRLKTLELYPKTLKLNFNIEEWKKYCILNYVKADRYRKSKTTTDFNFEGGRTAQRAYLDCFRDFLPQLYGLKSTLRLNEFETNGIFRNDKDSCKRIEILLKSKIK